MKILLILILLLESIATGCQNSDLGRKPETGEASPIPTSEAPPTENAASSSPATTTPTPQSLPRIAKTPQALSKSETKPSPRSTKRVAAIPQNPDSSQQSCQIGAYVIDKDPKGLNVRSGPGNDYKVIDNLPTTTIGVIVGLTASQGDWVQLSKAQSPQKIEFQGSGWVYAPLLGTSTRGYATKSVSVYPSANTQSQAIGRIPSQRGVKLLSCDRSWALVEYEGLKGWIAPDAQCPNPLTTCP
jgi:SH3-like domain-containing protein